MIELFCIPEKRFENFNNEPTDGDIEYDFKDIFYHFT